MPWKESSVMEERLHFVARLLEGEPMSDVARAFGISRKTGYSFSTATARKDRWRCVTARGGRCGRGSSGGGRKTDTLASLDPRQQDGWRG
jgi:transposase